MTAAPSAESASLDAEQTTNDRKIDRTVIAHRERAEIVDLFGQLEWVDGYGYQSERDRG